MHKSDSGYDITPLDAEAIERLAQDLNEEEYRILLNHGTEPPFCGTLLDNKMDGVYACRLCGLPLFSSSAKFHSGTGWPSFYKPFEPTSRTTATVCAASRSAAHAAAATKDTSSPTARHQRDKDIV
jgi:peptide methionine sulfoxide reductase MsrB